MPKISVIIPVYNVEKYLARCLDSVIAQTFSDIEIICINDGSTDNAGQILSEYAKKDKRIKIITQENSGVVAARNNGIASSVGEYIYPLDGDDIIAPMTLEKLYNAIAAWAEDDFRSVNGQIEYLLTECVKQRRKNGGYVSKELDKPFELDFLRDE